MERLNNRRSVARIFCLLLSIFIVLGAYNASAAPQPLPFDFFVPGLGSLSWDDIDNDGGDLGTGSPFSGDCFDSGTGLNISDAHSASDDDDAYDGAWLTTVNTTFVGTAGVGDLTGNTFTQGPQSISGLGVTYQLFFSEDTQCHRFIFR